MRREGKQLRRYVHVSTGNYNVVTAKSLHPISASSPAILISATTYLRSSTFLPDSTLDRRRPADRPNGSLHVPQVHDLSGYNAGYVLRLIDREIQKSTAKSPGRIIAKMNALIDTKVIRKLYEASRAGVHIDLLARGICCLRPGVPNISENIRVISILDPFLSIPNLLLPQWR